MDPSVAPQEVSDYEEPTLDPEYVVPTITSLVPLTGGNCHCDWLREAGAHGCETKHLAVQSGFRSLRF